MNTHAWVARQVMSTWPVRESWHVCLPMLQSTAPMESYSDPSMYNHILCIEPRVIRLVCRRRLPHRLPHNGEQSSRHKASMRIRTALSHAQTTIRTPLPTYHYVARVFGFVEACKASASKTKLAGNIQRQQRRVNLQLHAEQEGQRPCRG